MQEKYCKEQNNNNNNKNNILSIPEIHQSGYRTCHYIIRSKVQSESTIGYIL